MKAYPFLLNKDASGGKLKSIDVKGKRYSEAWLQEVLRTQPELLPVAEIETIFSPVISIGSEISTEGGAIDNLCISPRGYLTIIETKLWRNPEARREVVAQVMDYANALSRWTYDKLNTEVRKYTARYENAELELIQLVEREFGDLDDHDFFVETVEKNLRLGRFLALIVGDRIRESAVEVAKYVNEHPGLALNLALVELQCYALEGNKDWPLLMVPRIVKQTEIIERSVVQVTVVEGKPAKVEIHQEKAKDDAGRKVRVSLTEEAFWEHFKRNASECYDTAKELIEKYRNRTGITVDPKESSLVVRFNPVESGQSISVFFLRTDARLGVWPMTIERQLERIGFDSSLSQDYSEKVRQSMRMSKTRKDYSRHIQKIDIKVFAHEVDKFLSKLERSAPEENM